MRPRIATFLMLTAIPRPWHSFQSRRFDLSSAIKALTVRSVRDALQGIANFFQSVRESSSLVKSLRAFQVDFCCVGRISDVDRVVIGCTALETGDFFVELALFIQQFLLEVLYVHVVIPASELEQTYAQCDRSDGDRG